MIKKLYNHRFRQSFLLAFSLIAALLLPGFTFDQQHNDSITLKDEPVEVTGGDYHVSDVMDRRAERGWTALLVKLNNNGITNTETTDFTGGPATALHKFINHNLPQRGAGKAITIEIKELRLTESVLPGNRVEGKITIALSFNLQYNEDVSTHLVNYHSSVSYNRPANAVAVTTAEPVLRHSIENALRYFDKWISIQTDDNPKLARSVRLTFSDLTEKDKSEDDTIYYSPLRPITWNDFREHPKASRYAAEVLPGFGYNEETRVENGVIQVHLTLKVYLPKSSCWVNTGGMSSYSLNHEQRHFDIVKLVSEHFKDKLSHIRPPVYNYDGPISVEYFESYREMNHLQEQYDKETEHGLNEAAQARWNNLIDKELKKYGVIPERQI
jgi:hypothetical protein